MPGYYIEVRRKLNAYGQPTEALKSRNAYRRIPFHYELQAILDKLRTFLLDQTGMEPTGYICCPENSFGAPCTYAHFAMFAQHVVFSRFSDEILEDCALQMAWADLTHSEDCENSDTLTLYVLRRNFWTWLEAGSQLDEADRRYAMGHAMDNIKRDLIRKYNDIDRLWMIGQRMNRVSFPSNCFERENVTILGDPGAQLTASSIGAQAFQIQAGPAEAKKRKSKIPGNDAGANAS